MKRFVICEINEEYLKNVKKQMKKKKMPTPKEDSLITIAHKPRASLELDDISCNCGPCKIIKTSKRN